MKTGSCSLCPPHLQGYWGLWWSPSSGRKNAAVDLLGENQIDSSSSWRCLKLVLPESSSGGYNRQCGLVFHRPFFLEKLCSGSIWKSAKIVTLFVSTQVDKRKEGQVGKPLGCSPQTWMRTAVLESSHRQISWYPPEAVKAEGFIPECRYQKLQKGDIAQGWKKVKNQAHF